MCKLNEHVLTVYLLLQVSATPTVQFLVYTVQFQGSLRIGESERIDTEESISNSLAAVLMLKLSEVIGVELVREGVPSEGVFTFREVVFSVREEHSEQVEQLKSQVLYCNVEEAINWVLNCTD